MVSRKLTGKFWQFYGILILFLWAPRIFLNHKSDPASRHTSSAYYPRDKSAQLDVGLQEIARCGGAHFLEQYKTDYFPEFMRYGLISYWDSQM